jgi:hypothetical protein
MVASLLFGLKAQRRMDQMVNKVAQHRGTPPLSKDFQCSWSAWTLLGNKVNRTRATLKDIRVLYLTNGMGGNRTVEAL